MQQTGETTAEEFNQAHRAVLIKMTASNEGETLKIEYGKPDKNDAYLTGIFLARTAVAALDWARQL